MPFSRSRSPESRTRSTTASFARNVPVWRSIASTSVVLPWSTWATIATLRRSARTAVAARSGGLGHGAVGSVMGRRIVAQCGTRPSARVRRRLLASRSMTVAAVILAAIARSPRSPTPTAMPAVRRIADVAWSGGALPIVVVAPDPDGAVAAALAGAAGDARRACPDRSAGPVGQMVRGIEVAADRRSRDDAAL